MMNARYWRSILSGILCAALTVAFPIITITRGALQHINVLGWNERILINLAIVFGAITAGAAHKTVLQTPSSIDEKPKKPTTFKENLQFLRSRIAKNQAFLLLQITVLLNTAAAVLCKRISATQIGACDELQLIVSATGLVIFVCGALILGLSVINKPMKAQEKVAEATHGYGAKNSVLGNGHGNGNGNGKVLTDDSISEGAAADNADADAKQEMKTDDSNVLKKTKKAKLKTAKAFPLVQYPELAAWLIIVAGISLVENAWMPLLSLPGMIVAMKWYLSGKAAAMPFAGDGEELDVSKARWKIVPFIY